MCLAIPGKIVEATLTETGMRLGKVLFGGITRSVNLDLVPEAGPGDYVVVHVGFALSKVNEDEARRALSILEQMGALEAELSGGGGSPDLAGEG